MKKITGSCLFILAFTLVFMMIFWHQIFQFWVKTPSKTTEEISFVIESGEGVSSIADRLEEVGLIKNAFWFKVFARLSGESGTIQAGNFILPVGLSYHSLMDELSLAFGDEVSVTFPEGRTAEEYAEVVTENFSISKEEWVTAAKPYEGFLFPETYRFPPEATAEDIVLKMRNTFNSRIEKEGIEVTMNDLIIASIVEKEAGHHEDMPIVAGILYNRLDIGMALQLDSTLFYVVPFGQFDSSIDTPYNTYMYAGLPPGPISNPGIQAIRAALAPEPSPYFFFLTTPDTNEAIYAETFAEHSRNVQTYLR